MDGSKNLKLNISKNTMYQNLYDAARLGLVKKCKNLKIYIRK